VYSLTPSRVQDYQMDSYNRRWRYCDVCHSARLFVLRLQCFVVDPSRITASVTAEGISFSGAAFTDSMVVAADLVADNGVIHKVNRFFLPAALTQTLLDLTKNTPQVRRVARLFATSGLEGELAAPGRTLFTPSDGAFSTIPDSFFKDVAGERPISLFLLTFSPTTCAVEFTRKLSWWMVSKSPVPTINDKTMKIRTVGARWKIRGDFRQRLFSLEWRPHWLE
jgi:hypothetical protein